MLTKKTGCTRGTRRSAPQSQVRGSLLVVVGLLYLLAVFAFALYRASQDPSPLRQARFRSDRTEIILEPASQEPQEQKDFLQIVDLAASVGWKKLNTVPLKEAPESYRITSKVGGGYLAVGDHSTELLPDRKALEVFLRSTLHTKPPPR